MKRFDPDVFFPPLIALTIVFFGIGALWIVFNAPLPKPRPEQHIASDCRAACTLEGMDFAGVEISTVGVDL